MHTIFRFAVLSLLLLALAPLTAHAQLQAGSSLFFDHSAEDRADTEKYQICVDSVTDATCRDVSVLRVGTTDTYSLTLPGFVARGNRTLQVRAVGFGDTGASAGSNTLSVRVIGKPGPPVLLRLTEARE